MKKLKSLLKKFQNLKYIEESVLIKEEEDILDIIDNDDSLSLENDRILFNKEYSKENEKIKVLL